MNRALGATGGVEDVGPLGGEEGEVAHLDVDARILGCSQSAGKPAREAGYLQGCAMRVTFVGLRGNQGWSSPAYLPAVTSLSCSSAPRDPLRSRFLDTEQRHGRRAHAAPRSRHQSARPDRHQAEFAKARTSIGPVESAIHQAATGVSHSRSLTSSGCRRSDRRAATDSGPTKYFRFD